MPVVQLDGTDAQFVQSDGHDCILRAGLSANWGWHTSVTQVDVAPVNSRCFRVRLKSSGQCHLR